MELKHLYHIDSFISVFTYLHIYLITIYKNRQQ